MVGGVSTDPVQPVSLRERKKRATRMALSNAALQLAIERGLEHVLVEDIAAAAGVAPRTFNNYFPSKEAAILAEGADRAARMRDALRARPSDEPLWTALRLAVAELFAGGEPDRIWVTKARLIKATPALRVEQLKSDTSVQRLLAEEIARRIGANPRRDLYPRLAAAAVISAVRAALDHWLDAEPATPLAAVVSQALRQLADGLPVPSENSENSENCR
jgi:AcrR family transcriptional regulator